jgi:hypothetical protein
MPLTTPQDPNAVTEERVAQARTEAELRLVQIDIEEARAAGKTETVVSTVAAAKVH